MKISSRVDYALSCALRIANAYTTGKPVTVKYISEKEQLAVDYVEQLLIVLKKAGILKSIRGALGGYILSRQPKEITAKEIVVAVEKDVLKLVCFREKGRKIKCVHMHDCKVRAFWLGLKDSMEKFLRKHTLKDLLYLRMKEKNW